MGGVRLLESDPSKSVKSVIPLSQFSDHLSTPPSGLTAMQRKCWREWAPLALTMRTLTAETVPGFRELCERAELKRALWKELRKIGFASEAAAETRRAYDKAALRLNTSLAEFQLTGTGKPQTSASAARAAIENPWAQVAGR